MLLIRSMMTLGVCMQWLESKFLGYLKEWQDSVKLREGFTDGEKAMMLLSQETLEGLHITGRFFS